MTPSHGLRCRALVSVFPARHDGYATPPISRTARTIPAIRLTPGACSRNPTFPGEKDERKVRFPVRNGTRHLKERPGQLSRAPLPGARGTARSATTTGGHPRRKPPSGARGTARQTTTHPHSPNNMNLTTKRRPGPSERSAVAPGPRVAAGARGPGPSREPGERGSAGREPARLGGRGVGVHALGGEDRGGRVGARGGDDQGAAREGVGPLVQGREVAPLAAAASRRAGRRALRAAGPPARRAARRRCPDRRRARRAQLVGDGEQCGEVAGELDVQLFLAANGGGSRWACRPSCCGPTWCGSARTWDGLLRASGSHPSLDSV